MKQHSETETVKFRFWLNELICFIGRAEVKITKGSPERDEFGFYDDGEIEVDIKQVWKETQVEDDLGIWTEVYEKAPDVNPQILSGIEAAAVDAFYSEIHVVSLPDEEGTCLAAGEVMFTESVNYG